MLSKATLIVRIYLSQISYSLVVILELSGVLEVQYKKIMIRLGIWYTRKIAIVKDKLVIDLL